MRKGAPWINDPSKYLLDAAAAAAGLWANAYATDAGLLLVVADGLGAANATAASLTTDVGTLAFGARPVLAAAFALHPGGAAAVLRI